MNIFRSSRAFKNPRTSINRGVSVMPNPPRMTRSQARLIGELSQPQKTTEKEVIIETPPKKKNSRTLEETIVVYE
jgi:hypothetical protein